MCVSTHTFYNVVIGNPPLLQPQIVICCLCHQHTTAQKTALTCSPLIIMNEISLTEMNIQIGFVQITK